MSLRRATPSPLVLGIITLLVIVVTSAVIIVVGRLPLGQTSYEAEFAQAAQIRPGDGATVAGISVGSVEGVRLAGDRVVVSFRVRDDVRLGSDTRAAIKLTTILGSRYLELSPAGTGDLPDHRIPLSNTAVPYDLQRTLQDSTTTFEQIDADRVTQSLTVLSTSLQGLPEALPGALDNVKALSSIIADRRHQITTLLASSDQVTTLLRNQRADLGVLILQGRDLLREAVSRQDALRRLFDSVTVLVNRIEGILHDQPAIRDLVADVSSLADLLGRNDALLKDLLQVLPVTVRNVTNTFGSSNAAEVVAPAGPFIDSWMCAISGRAKQFGLTEYFQDCEPAPDPFPGWPPPQPERLP